MPDERYGKCDVCRFCVHSDDDWVCALQRKVVHRKSSCGRYRPGSCENCSHADVKFGEAHCRRFDKDVDTLDVCPDYDPCARYSVGSEDESQRASFLSLLRSRAFLTLSLAIPVPWTAFFADSAIPR